MPQPANDRGLVDAFAAYLRRQLGGPDEEVAVLEPNEAWIPRAAKIGVVVGERGPLWRRLTKAKTGMSLRFAGTAYAHPTWPPAAPGLPIMVWDRWDPRPKRVEQPPDTFRVRAVITAFNEEDIIEQTLNRLLSDGVEVQVIDNWSTDSTVELVKRVKTEHPNGSHLDLDSWPPDGPTEHFELQTLLSRVQHVAHRSGADWLIHQDADEIRESPWPGIGLRQALWALDRWGFNAIEYVGLDFRPIDDRWRPGEDLDRTFEWFEFGTDAGYFTMIKAWKRQPQEVPLEGGGHDANFPGRRVFPYKFLLRHYPIRSQAHGERKVLQERIARWSPEERALGWHVHYDRFVEDPTFVWDPSALHRWDALDAEMLIQRLSGAALPGNPREPETLGPPPGSAAAG